MAYYRYKPRAFSVQHACGLLTTPTLLACADATVHPQAQCCKESSSHKTALQYIECNISGYRACDVFYRALAMIVTAIIAPSNPYLLLFGIGHPSMALWT